MKLYGFLILSLLITIHHVDVRHELICQKWWLFGIKEKNKPYTSISRSTTLLFKKDGTFESHELINDFQGVWEFNNDTTKIITKTLYAKGGHLGTVQFSPKSDSLVKLTKDTLIFLSADNTMLYYVSDK